ncbi:hypothetical protein [Ktedonospora formicarum]|uniref:Uncharacterized protein n=1 Tax=Ktedonospora formicarum TaxID=2778364 RepID=A0A8J3MSN2_9CHLR|nr:hypothetical protein [Ktedonospora formicarum]GHO45041.1 hypothetical protein KSX_32040 [Ktedonospora formicarum]
MADSRWEEQKQTRNSIAIAGLIAEPTEPTGDEPPVAPGFDSHWEVVCWSQ